MDWKLLYSLNTFLKVYLRAMKCCFTMFRLRIYVYKYIRGAFNMFPDFFVQAFKSVVDSWKFTMLLLYIWWDDWTNVYDFRFKWTATAAIGMHPTKAWLSQLVNFKNAIWTWEHFRRTICNKILLLTWKKCHRNVWNASDCFLTIVHESRISFWVA